ncbi:MAG TPA: guanylate kinase [Candidatus Margulisiibacteriota bacterium]|nr:guanylate kinase [Candidatus Margulisiibacteriota bacterium]
MKGLVFVISGPSGSGKTSLAGALLESAKLKKILVKSVSSTTRPKRSGEKNGRDYFFLTVSQFREGLRDKKFLEWTRYLGYYYATPKDFLEKQLRRKKNIVLCLDLRGALRIKRLYPDNAVTIFIRPPSLDTLKKRIEKRCSKTLKDEVRRRLKLGREELLGLKHYDYSLVNKNFIPAVKRLERIVLKEIKNKTRGV